GFARQAGQAAVQVRLRGRPGRAALQQLLDQVYAPARTVQFVALQLVGRARGIAEAAVHATAQDGVCAPGGVLVQDSGLQLRTHRRSELPVHALRVQDSAGIEDPLEAAVD